MKIRKPILTTLMILATFFVSSVVIAQDSGGQIDIKADEQEFDQGHVIARGKVRVDYGETIIYGPKATLYRDDSGAASSAVFTGGPHLKQGRNTIRGI